MSADLSALRAENERLRQGLWDVWAALGGDTDGDTGPAAWISGSGVDGFIAAVVRDAAEWRRQTEDDYDADTTALEAERNNLAAVLAHVEANLSTVVDLLDVPGPIAMHIRAARDSARSGQKKP